MVNEGENMPRKEDRRYCLSLHGDIKIDTRSNRMPRKATGYEAEDAGLGGGRVWIVHKDGSRTWLCDTVMADTAMAMAEDLDATVENDD